MADKIIEKRKYMWKITNFTRDAVDKYKVNESVKSENFEVLLRDNMTKWYFLFYPKNEDFNELYIHKFAVDRDDFRIKINATIQKTDDTMPMNVKTLHIPNVIPLGHGRGWKKFMAIENIFKPENKFVASDTLTLIINIELLQEGPCAPLAKKPRLDFAQPEWIAKIFNSEVFSDVTFVCSDKKSIPAHRCILAGRSPVFKTMLTTDMTKKKSNKITFPDIKSDTMMEFMRYIYKQEVQDLKKHASKLLDCAEKYDIPDLKKICVQQLIVQLSDENVFENLLLAKLHNERKSMEKCMDYIDTNFKKLKESEEWKKVDVDLMFSIMNYMQERSKGIELTNSL